MEEFLGLRVKTYSYLTIDGNEDKNGKDIKKYAIEKKRKFEEDICLDGNQLENKINHLEENNIDVGSPENDDEEFIKANKLILKTRQRF